MVGKRDAIKHGGFLVIRVVMYVWLREPNFAACDWMGSQWRKCVPVVKISGVLLPFIIEVFSL